MLASKVKEQSMRTKYDQERQQTALEQKFKQLIQAREDEWELAWQRRDGLLATKELTLRDAETER